MDKEIERKLATKAGQKKLGQIVAALIAENTPEYKLGKKEKAKELLNVAIEWIACNDDTTGTIRETSSLISILLVADVFGKSPMTIAREVRLAKQMREQSEKF
jgi:hypothetical protein